MKWFKHHVGSLKESNLSYVHCLHGSDGFKVWFLLLEHLADQFDGNNEDFSQHYTKIWAEICKVSKKKFEKILESMEKRKMVCVDREGDLVRINCPTLLNLQDEYTRKKRLKQAKGDENQVDLSGQSPPRLDKIRLDKNREDKIRLDKTRVDKTRVDKTRTEQTTPLPLAVVSTAVPESPPSTTTMTTPTTSTGPLQADKFAMFWAAYPKRSGSNSKAAAIKAWNARLRSKIQPDEILAGVERYHHYCNEEGLTHTPYVKQAAGFLGPNLCFRESWAVTGTQRTKQTVASPGGEGIPSGVATTEVVAQQQDQVHAVFVHWREVMEHPNAQLDAQRSRLIKDALKMGYSKEQLCDAIRGCAQTPHNQGHNERGQRYDGLHIILRNADQIDRFIHNCHNPPQLQTKANQRLHSNQQAIQSWVDQCEREYEDCHETK